MTRRFLIQRVSKKGDFSMNRRPQGLEASKAVIGFLQYKGAEGLAPITVTGYERDLKLWIEHMGDIDVVRITSQHILSFLNYMRTDYVPRRIAGDNTKKLAPKTVYNIYFSLAYFLAHYKLPYDPNYPMICDDERPCFLIGETVAPLVMQSGRVRREHYAYDKLGFYALRR
jgi:hypothetical protein